MVQGSDSDEQRCKSRSRHLENSFNAANRETKRSTLNLFLLSQWRHTYSSVRRTVRYRSFHCTTTTMLRLSRLPPPPSSKHIGPHCYPTCWTSSSQIQAPPNDEALVLSKLRNIRNLAVSTVNPELLILRHFGSSNVHIHERLNPKKKDVNPAFGTSPCLPPVIDDS